MRRRYRQVQQEDGTYKLVEVTHDRLVADSRALSIVQRDLDFVSVVDGSRITSHRALAEHNARNNVVHESEFGTAAERKSFFDRKSAERADLYQGTAHTHYGQRLKRERRHDIARAIRQHESS